MSDEELVSIRRYLEATSVTLMRIDEELVSIRRYLEAISVTLMRINSTLIGIEAAILGADSTSIISSIMPDTPEEQ